MNIAVFIIVMATLAIVDGLDCQNGNYLNDHDRFICRHVLQEIIDKTDSTAWETYIRKYGLCNRPTQSFMVKQEPADKICQGYGKPVSYTCSNQVNFCTSNSPISIYRINLNSNCQVTNRYVKPTKYFVVVSCQNVNNLCLPVHFDRTENIRLDWTGRPCR